MTVPCKTILKVGIILIMVTNHQILARPGGEWDNNVCKDDQNLTEMCQRCAKQTKSNMVYPLCCNKEEEVHHWCTRYTSFGKVA